VDEQTVLKFHVIILSWAHGDCNTIIVLYLQGKLHAALLQIKGIVTHVKPTDKVCAIVSRNHYVIFLSTVEMVIVQIVNGTDCVTTFAHHGHAGFGIILQNG
jgi:hypothetical protein